MTNSTEKWLGYKDGKVVATFDSRGAAAAALDRPFNKRTVDAVSPVTETTPFWACKHGTVFVEPTCDCFDGFDVAENAADAEMADWAAQENATVAALEAAAKAPRWLEDLVWQIWDRVEPTFDDARFGPGYHAWSEAEFQRGWDMAKEENR